MPPHTSDSPAKKQSKWSPEEDALIIELRGSGMKWDDISKRLPGRSSISCRLHYQNYLERRSEWDEERKNKLARLYERFKPEMWAKVAEEMQVPWRAAEAMHWQLGEHEMARRAGVSPFTLNSVGPETPQQGVPLSRGHTLSQPLGNLPRDLSEIPSTRYGRGGPHMSMPSSAIPPPSLSSGTGRTLLRREPLPPPPPFGHDTGGDILSYTQLLPPPPPPPPPYPGMPIPGPGLAPIQGPGTPHGQGRGSVLPGLAELTTNVTPYNTPAYSPGLHSVSPMHGHSNMASPGLSTVAAGYANLAAERQQSGSRSTVLKRRRSPGMGTGSSPRETNRRRHLETRQQ